MSFLGVGDGPDPLDLLLDLAASASGSASSEGGDEGPEQDAGAPVSRSSLASSPLRRADAATLRNKVCCACRVAADVRSPICTSPGGKRDW